MILLFSLSGCHNEKLPACTFQKETESNIGDGLARLKLSREVLNLINANAVKVNAQSVKTNRYEVKLDEFFYDKGVPIAIFKFVVSKKNGKKMSGSDVRELKNAVKEKDLDIANCSLGSTELEDTIEIRDGVGIWTLAYLLASISGADKPQNIKEKSSLGTIDILDKDKNQGTIVLPDYSSDLPIKQLDTGASKSVLSVIINDMGLNVIVDITTVLKEYRKMLKNLPKGQDPEKYGYDVFKLIQIVQKNGTIVDIYGKEKGSGYRENEEVYQENKLASYTVLFGNQVKKEEIESVIINGESFS